MMPTTPLAADDLPRPLTVYVECNQYGKAGVEYVSKQLAAAIDQGQARVIPIYKTSRNTWTRMGRDVS